MGTSFSHTVTVARRAVRLTLALTLVACTLNVARGEYVAKTFYATFDDGTVITGTFSGDTGDDNILVTDYDVLEVYEVDQFTLDVYVPGYGHLGELFTHSWEYTRPWDSNEDLLWVFFYDTDDNFFSVALWDYGDAGHWFQIISHPDWGMWYDAFLDIFSWNWLFGSSSSGSWVTITDIGTGVTFERIADHIAAGLAAGVIDNSGIAGSLVTMLEAAGSAAANGKPETAVRILNAFIHRVDGQSGKHLTPVMAQLLIDDATAVIDFLLR